MRLVDGGPGTARGERWFGLVLRLKPGFKTYWRHPGDSGVPPVLVFDGSSNLASATVHFPAPKRFDDGAGGTAFGYEGDEVILPVLATASDPAAPIRLSVKADYAVCEKLCVLASGSAELTAATGQSAFAGSVGRAVASVPAKAAIGEPGPLRVLGLRRSADAGVFHVDVAARDGLAPELFIEAPQPWFLEAGAFKPAVGETKAGFAVRVVQRAKQDEEPDIVLTLVGRGGTKSVHAVEVRTRLDIGLIAP